MPANVALEITAAMNERIEEKGEIGNKIGIFELVLMDRIDFVVEKYRLQGLFYVVKLSSFPATHSKLQWRWLAFSSLLPKHPGRVININYLPCGAALLFQQP